MENSILQQLKTIVLELSQLYTKVQNHIKYQESSEGYVYSNTYHGWVHEYNTVIKKYNALTSVNLSYKTVSEYELSTSQKTVRIDVAKSFAQSIKELSEKIETDIRNEQNKETPIPLHQMRKCFKLGIRGCPMKPDEKKNKVFVAMPFNNEHKDSFEYGIKIILDQTATEYYKADVEISNKDMMCKICNELQSCGRMIANISGHNPNVMLELGLAYGLGKDVIVIKDKNTTAISDLGSVEYIEYSHAGELQQKLLSLF